MQVVFVASVHGGKLKTGVCSMRVIHGYTHYTKNLCTGDRSLVNWVCILAWVTTGLGLTRPELERRSRYSITMGVESGGRGDTSPNQNIWLDVLSKNTHENIK